MQICQGEAHNVGHRSHYSRGRFAAEWSIASIEALQFKSAAFERDISPCMRWRSGCIAVQIIIHLSSSVYLLPVFVTPRLSASNEERGVAAADKQPNVTANDIVAHVQRVRSGHELLLSGINATLYTKIRSCNIATVGTQKIKGIDNGKH